MIHQCSQHICSSQLCPRDTQESLHHGVLVPSASSTISVLPHPEKHNSFSSVPLSIFSIPSLLIKVLETMKPEGSETDCYPSPLLFLSISS